MQVSRSSQRPRRTVQRIKSTVQQGINKARDFGRQVVDKAKGLFQQDYQKDSFQKGSLNPSANRSVTDFVAANGAKGQGIPTSPQAQQVANMILGDSQGPKKVSPSEFRNAFASVTGNKSNFDQQSLNQQVALINSCGSVAEQRQKIAESVDFATTQGSSSSNRGQTGQRQRRGPFDKFPHRGIITTPKPADAYTRSQPISFTNFATVTKFKETSRW